MFYGNNSGVVSSYTFDNCVKVFGMENYWGFAMRKLNGWTMKDYTHHIKYTFGQEDGSTSNGYDYSNANGYINTGISFGRQSWGAVKTCKFTDSGLYAYEWGSDHTKYYCSGAMVDPGTKQVWVCGRSDDVRDQYNEPSYGIAYVAAGHSYDNYYYCCSSISCRPLEEE